MKQISKSLGSSIFNFNFEYAIPFICCRRIIINISENRDGQEVFWLPGSNSLVSKISRERSIRLLEMKIKSDTQQEHIPYVTIEYEYDGIEPNPQTGKIGEVEEHELNLQVVEMPVP